MAPPRFLRLTTGLLLLLAGGVRAQSNMVNDRGKEFWMGFMQNAGGAMELRVMIASINGTSGTIEMPLTGWSTPYTVPANGVTTVLMPLSAENQDTEVAHGIGIRVTAQDSVTVNAMSYLSPTAESTQVFPLTSLGTEYRVDAYSALEGWSNMFQSEFLIVGTADGTEMTITPTANTMGGHAAGVPFTVQLDAGETYQVKATESSLDLTGTRVVGTAQSGPCRPFAVFGGSKCAQVPTTCQACDHIYEQLFPVRSWGKNFHTVPLQGLSSYTWRVMADQNGTLVSVDGGTPFLLNAGQVHEENHVVQPVCITASKPVSVTEFMQGSACSGAGDPSFVQLIPDDRLTRTVVFSTPSFQAAVNHGLSVVTPTAAVSQMVLDGAPINASLFQTYPGCAGFSYAKLLLPAGTHKLSSSTGFMGYSYGATTIASYFSTIGSVSVPAPTTSNLVCSGDEITLSPPIPLANPVWTAGSAPSTVLGTTNSYTFTPDHNDIYHVNGVLPVSGCPQHYEFQVGLPVEPDLQLNVDGQSTATVCQYAPAQLGSGTPLDPAWFDLQWTPAAYVSDPHAAAPIAFPNSTTWFKLSVTSPMGCGSAVDSVLVTVTPNDLYAVHASTGDDAICAGNTTDLKAKAERVVRADAFEGPPASWWAQVQGGTSNTTCGSVSGRALYFNGNAGRSATTTPMDLSAGGRLHFALKIAAGAAPCDDADPGEDVRVEYSLNGVTWTPLNTFNEAMYPSFTAIDVEIPALGSSAANMVVRWRQLANSGAGQDNWCLDDVVITRYNNAGLGLAWTPAATVSTPSSANTNATPAADTWYHIAATTSAGCSYTDSVHIDVAPAFSILPINDTTRCGTAGTLLHAAVTSGTGIQWGWTPNNGSLDNVSIAGPLATPTTTTTYTVTATNSIGCTDTEDVKVSVGQLTGLSVSADDQMLCYGESAHLTATIGANGPYTVSWTPATGLNDPSSPTPIATPLANTTYTCTVTDNGSGCSLIASVPVQVRAAYHADVTPHDTTVCTALGLQLHVQHDVPGPYTIAWSPAANLNASNIAAPTILEDTTTTYVVVITDASGCIVSDSSRISVAFDNLITPVYVSECVNTPLVLDAGFPGSTYEWSTNETTQTITVTQPGTYTATMTDIQQCQAIMNFIATFDPLPTVDLGPDLALCGVPSHTLDAANPGNSVHWSTGPNTQQLTVTATGQYDVLVTTPQGCEARDTIHLSLDPLPVDVLQDITVCEDQPPTLDAGNAGSQFLWSTSQATQTIVPHAGGLYTVTVTTSANCSATFDAQVTLMPLVHVDLGPDTTLCAGQPLVLDAGNAGNTITWAGGQHTQTLAVNTSDSYSVEVTNGYCTATDAIAVIFDPIPVDELTDVTSCIDQPVTLDAGNAGAAFLWGQGETTPTLTVTTNGTYTVQVTNANQCSATFDAQVTFVDYPVVDLGVDTALCDGEAIVLDAGNPGAMYTWSSGPNTRMITVTEEGEYTVSVNNGHCITTDSRYIDFHPVPGAVADANMTICFDEQDAVQLDAGNPGCSYTWSTGEHTRTIDATAYGTYTVRITNIFDCSVDETVTVTEFCPPSLYIPNTFTPNGDNLNDVWMPVGRNIGTFELIIFDRWGGIAFQTNDPNKGWDGNIDGKPAPNDAYAWRLTYRFVEKSNGSLGFEHKQLGHVQIMH